MNLTLQLPVDTPPLAQAPDVCTTVDLPGTGCPCRLAESAGTPVPTVEFSYQTNGPRLFRLKLFQFCCSAVLISIQRAAA